MRLAANITWSILLLTICFSCKGPTERMEGYRVHGIDVSRYQGSIDWATIDTSQVHFVFVKATEGEEHVDSLFARNWAALNEKGIRKGAYHFYRPSISAQIQFRNYTNQVVLTKGDLPPVIDFEATGDLFEEEIKLSLKELLFLMQDYYKCKPIIYTNLKLYRRYIATIFDDYPIWIARYNNEVPVLSKSNAWAFWQYGNRGQIEGIVGDVDFNVFSGSIAELDALCIQ